MYEALFFDSQYVLLVIFDGNLFLTAKRSELMKIIVWYLKSHSWLIRTRNVHPIKRDYLTLVRRLFDWSFTDIKA